MKKYLLNSVLILFISAVSISCTNELTMDTSSDKAFAESLAKFQKKLKPKEFEKLGEVILAVSLAVGQGEWTRGPIVPDSHGMA